MPKIQLVDAQEAQKWMEGHSWQLSVASLVASLGVLVLFGRRRRESVNIIVYNKD